MISSELSQEFSIQPGRALLLLEAENLLASDPPESSLLRRSADPKEWPLIWDTRKINLMREKMIFVARKTARHNTHSEIESLLNLGHIVIADAEGLQDSSVLRDKPQQWFKEIVQHPNLILCTSSERARDLLLQNIASLRSSDWTTLAITGTNGKTSTTQIAATLLEELSHNPVLRMGTLGIRVAHHIWDNPFPTMPDFPGLLAALRASQSDFNCKQLVMEATSIGLEEKRMGDWQVQCAAFLNLTQDHLDYHGTLEKYLEAKLLLFKVHLRPDGNAIINCGDPHWQKVIQAAKGKNRFCVAFGSPGQRDIFFRETQNLFAAVRFLEISHRNSTTTGISGQWTVWNDPHTHVSQTQYSVRLLGDVQHENLAAAAALMLSLGYPLQQIASAAPSIRAIEGRLEPVESAEPSHAPCVLVDYAHSPDALEKTLLTCRKLLTNSGKLVCVFGCGGDRDPGKRPLMGRIAAQLADRTYVTSDNPRTEDPEKIIDDVIAGIDAQHKQKFSRQADRRVAILDAINSATKDDLVLIAGKGHEDYQIIGAQKYPFSDSEVARQALASKRNI